jgi:cell division protein FtsB
LRRQFFFSSLFFILFYFILLSIYIDRISDDLWSPPSLL